MATKRPRGMRDQPASSPPRKPGRPRKVVDEAAITELAGFGCTIAEIAARLGVGETTLKRNFGLALDRGHADLRFSLKRAQVQLALGGSERMLIWLGKQYLGQSDKSESTVRTDLSGLSDAQLERLAAGATIESVLAAGPRAS